MDMSDFTRLERLAAAIAGGVCAGENENDGEFKSPEGFSEFVMRRAMSLEAALDREEARRTKEKSTREATDAEINDAVYGAPSVEEIAAEAAKVANRALNMRERHDDVLNAKAAIGGSVDIGGGVWGAAVQSFAAGVAWMQEQAKTSKKKQKAGEWATNSVGVWRRWYKDDVLAALVIRTKLGWSWTSWKPDSVFEISKCSDECSTEQEAKDAADAALRAAGYL